MIDIIQLLEEELDYAPNYIHPKTVATFLKPIHKQTKALVKAKYPYLRVTNIDDSYGVYSFDIEYGPVDNVVLYVVLDYEEMAVGTDLYGWDRSRNTRIPVTPKNAKEVIEDKIKLAIRCGFVTPRKMF